MIRDGSLGLASLVNGIREGGKENENWRMLGRILRDPYLEKASLKAGRLVMVRNNEPGESWDLERCRDVTCLLRKPGSDQDGASMKVVSANYCRN